MSVNANSGLMAVGLSHRTAPVEVRERMAMDESLVKRNLKRLRDEGVCDEALLISTCNRVELYTVPKSVERLKNFLGEFRGPDGENIHKYLYWHRGQDAVVHLFRVASSLDSLVLGEPQILGQVKSAVRLAEESQSLGRVLNRLAHRSLSVAKRVRTQTAIGESRVGVGNAGVDLALQIFGDLRDKRALLVGVGEMGRQVARALLNSGLQELLVTNRTYERAVEVATEYGGTPLRWEKMKEYLGRVDVVITATGASQPIITSTDVYSALRARRWRPIFMVDLSVPRNIDPKVDDLFEAFLFNVDDLTQVVQRGYEARERASHAADQVVRLEADRFMEALKVIEVGDEIGRVAAIAEQMRQVELDRSKKLVASLDEEQRDAVDKMTRALVKRMLHRQMLELREAARRGDMDRIELISDLWKDDE